MTEWKTYFMNGLSITSQGHYAKKDGVNGIKINHIVACFTSDQCLKTDAKPKNEIGLKKFTIILRFELFFYCNRTGLRSLRVTFVLSKVCDFILKPQPGIALLLGCIWLDRWQARDAPFGCLPRSVGPSRFPLFLSLFLPLKQTTK